MLAPSGEMYTIDVSYLSRSRHYSQAQCTWTHLTCRHAWPPRMDTSYQGPARQLLLRHKETMFIDSAEGVRRITLHG